MRWVLSLGFLAALGLGAPAEQAATGTLITYSDSQDLRNNAIYSSFQAMKSDNAAGTAVLTANFKGELHQTTAMNTDFQITPTYENRALHLRIHAPGYGYLAASAGEPGQPVNFVKGAISVPVASIKQVGTSADEFWYILDLPCEIRGASTRATALLLWRSDKIIIPATEATASSVSIAVKVNRQYALAI